MSPRLRAALAALGVVLVARTAHAAGPLVVNGAGVPLVWRSSPVPFNPDRGPLGKLSNRAAMKLVAGNFAVWEAVPSASIRFRNAGRLPTDATRRTYGGFLGICDGLSPVIFDHDGRITDDLLGAGARDEVLGFATPECGDVAAGTITESIAVLNGRWIDGVATDRNPELSVDDFASVFVHEFGHFFNLDHSQVGRAEAFDEDPANDDAIATMFPFLVNGAEARTLAPDDVASVSALYPAPDAARSVGRITGRVLRGDGSPFQGAYVVARNLADPRRTAVGYTSGARYVPLVDGAPNPGGPPSAELLGAFELTGLPPGSYTVEIEPVDPRFTGGSGIGPLDPPAGLPTAPEFWNGADESDESPPDDPEAATPVVVAAGGTVEGIDIRLNDAPPPNDTCDEPLPIAAVPFTDARRMGTATTAADDPLQSCTSQGPAQNRASVWYRLVAPTTARLVVGTAGSTYDTVLAAFTGPCGALVPLACSDDTGPSVASRLDLDLAAGAVVTLEVTAFHDVAPATLALAVRYGCVAGSGPCDDGDPCTSGDVCADGECVGPVAVCDDGNPCTRDICDGTGGCTHAPAPGGCDDGDTCSVGDACAAGTCTSGPRVDQAAIVRTLRARLPAVCAGGLPALERVAAHGLARAAHALGRLLQSDPRRAHAFARAARALRRARHAAAELRKRGAERCGLRVLERVRVARDQMACVRADRAPRAR